MSTSQTFPNGTTLTSSALSIAEISAAFQQATCTALGITNKLAVQATLVEGSKNVTLAGGFGVAVDYIINDLLNVNIPANTTITAIAGNVITMSNAALGSASETVFITDPQAGNLVRQVWQASGAPAWTQVDNVSFVRCTEVDDMYNKVRDELATANDDVSGTLEIEYTRVWHVFWELRGPTSYDRGRLLKSVFQLDFIRDMLAAFNLYLMPNVGNPKRVPELVEGKWWERSDLLMEYYEQVNESIILSTVASIEVITNNSSGVQSDIVVI